MTDEHRDEFPATALIEAHLKVLDVAGAGDELLEALTDLVSMGRIGDEPGAVIDSSGTRHLVWRGYLTGGLITVWLRLGQALRNAEVSAFLGDPRLEVFVPAHGEIAVFGVLRHPIALSWEEWDERLRAAGSVEELVASFIHAAMSESWLFEPPARESMAAADDDDEDEDQIAFPEAERVREPMLYGPHPKMIEQLEPGQVDWELVDESDANLTISCDPEGSVEQESVVCYLMRWRTEFAAPGTVLADEPWQESFGWAVGQWQSVGEEQDDEGEEREWVLRGKEPLTVSKALEQMPQALRPWVLDSTTRAIRDLEHLAEEEPSLKPALEKLRDELAQVEARD
jgi:hypothetical protein